MTTRIQCSEHVNGDQNPMFQDLRQDMLDLKELYGVDALATLRMSWTDVSSLGREKAKRDLTKAVTEFLCKGWRRVLPPLVLR